MALAADNALEVETLLVGYRAVDTANHDFDVSGNRLQRRAQLMAYGSKEAGCRIGVTFCFVFKSQRLRIYPGLLEGYSAASGETFGELHITVSKPIVIIAEERDRTKDSPDDR